MWRCGGARSSWVTSTRLCSVQCGTQCSILIESQDVWVSKCYASCDVNEPGVTPIRAQVEVVCEYQRAFHVCVAEFVCWIEWFQVSRICSVIRLLLQCTELSSIKCPFICVHESRFVALCKSHVASKQANQALETKRNTHISVSKQEQHTTTSTASEHLLFQDSSSMPRRVAASDLDTSIDRASSYNTHMCSSELRSSPVGTSLGRQVGETRVWHS